MEQGKRISVGILGYGGRGHAMALAISSFPDEIYVKAIAEPEENRRQMGMGFSEKRLYG